MQSSGSNRKRGVVSFPRLTERFGGDPEQLYRTLVEEYKTFVIPAAAFELDNRHFRLGYGGTPKELQVGLKHLEKALSKFDR